MGVQAAPAYIADPTFNHPAELDRNILEGIWSRSGAVEPGNFALSVGAGTRAIAVAGGRFVIEGVENATQGSYFIWSDAPETFLLAAAVGNPRIDSFILRVADNQYGSIGGSPQAYIDVVQGVAAGSPTARPNSDFNVGGSFYVPGAWWRLGDVRVNVADTGSIPAGQITNNWSYATPPGQLLQVLSTQRPLVPSMNDRVYETDTGFTRAWDGSSWRQSEMWKSVQTLGSTTATVTFSSIPTSLKTVRLSCTARHDNASVYQDMLVRIGGDSGANYRFAGNFMQDTALGGVNGSAQTSGRIGFVCGTSVVAGQFTTVEAFFQGWNSPHANNLTALVRSGFTGNVGGHMLTWTGTMTYHGSNAYTSLAIFSGAGSFIAGSQFVLEGWE